VKPQNLVFDANLQEFSNKVSLICSLETGGKITPEEAYRQIKELWKQLKQTKKAILDNPQWKESPPDLPEE
jgi:polyhydroxyalkanoate synthesis regulator phasin